MNYIKSFQTIDTQVVGEAFRMVIHSPIVVVENSIQEAARVLENHFQETKNFLLNEPRGHRGMHGCLVAHSPVATFRLLFFQHEMSTNFKYEALAATLTALLEQGIIDVSTTGEYTIETVRGIYNAVATISESGEEVLTVKLQLPDASVIAEKEKQVEVLVDHHRSYLVVPKPLEIDALILDELSKISRWGLLSIENQEYDGIILYEEIARQKVRSVTFEKDGYILRSPGVDTTLALAEVLGEKNIKNESIFGSEIRMEESKIGNLTVSLKAYITGIHQFVLDDEDPLPEGFLIV